MASLASFTTLYVTAIRVDGPNDLKNIAALRLDGELLGTEESSVADFIAWLDRGHGRAFVRQPDGGRGPRVHVEYDGERRYVSSRSEDWDQEDALLRLPRWEPGRAAAKHTSRTQSRAHRWDKWPSSSRVSRVAK